MSDYIEITSEKLPKILSDTCKTFADENVKKKVKSGIRKIARESKAEISAISPTGKVNLTRDYTHYKDGWTTSTKEENGVFRVVVHNKKWQLVHLLELGHVLRDGTGRVYGEVPAYEHVQSTYDNADKKVDALLEDL